MEAVIIPSPLRQIYLINSGWKKRINSLNVRNSNGSTSLWGDHQLVKSRSGESLIRKRDVSTVMCRLMLQKAFFWIVLWYRTVNNVFCLQSSGFDSSPASLQRDITALSFQNKSMFGSEFQFFCEDSFWLRRHHPEKMSRAVSCF